MVDKQAKYNNKIDLLGQKPIQFYKNLNHQVTSY